MILASVINQPLYLLGRVIVSVTGVPSPFRFLVIERLEQLRVKRLGAFHEHKPTVLWAIRKEVEDPLNAVETWNEGRLVDMRPWFEDYVVFVSTGDGHGHVEPVWTSCQHDTTSATPRDAPYEQTSS